MTKNKTKEEKNVSYLNKIRKEIKKDFTYIDSLEDLPKRTGGSMVRKIDCDNINRVFHFLEFIFEKEYVDLFKKQGFIFIDDKVTWEFLIKTEFGYFRVYDWKGYSVSIGSDGGMDTDPKLIDMIDKFKKIIEDNIGKFIELKSDQLKIELKEKPLTNFMNAFVSLDILFGISKETNKKGTGFLESLILYVSLIDTMLRYSILLTRINKRKSKNIDPDLWELFFQKDKKFLSEREIFKLAQQEVDFLNHDKDLFFKKANDLYDERNKAVHRYAITNFQYIDIKKILEENEALRSVLSDIVVGLEAEQAELGVGFITKESLNFSEDEAKKEIDKIVESKINPAIFTKELPKRDAMFSDKFKEGVNPKFKKIFDKMYKKK